VTRRDKATLWLIAFFVTVALTIEVYWLLHASVLPATDSWLARGFRFYGIGDRGYYDQVSWFEVGLESFHVGFTVPIYLWLGYAIATRRSYRWPLQLCVGSYVAYSVVLYFTAKHVTGYAQMQQHDLEGFLILIVPNLPWLLGHLWLAFDAGGTILRAVRAVERPT
jgi:cholestenol Delta-isomerase